MFFLILWFRLVVSELGIIFDCIIVIDRSLSKLGFFFVSFIDDRRLVWGVFVIDVV